MKTTSGLSGPVLAFAQEMQTHLDKNGYGTGSPSWAHLTTAQKIHQLRLSITRLETSLNEPESIHVTLSKRFTVDSQAAIVGCFSMMIADAEGYHG